MLIALVGPACSGKFEIAKYLIVHHHFRPAFLTYSSSLQQHGAELLPLCHSGSDTVQETFEFESTQSLLEHSTAHWRDNIVTLDLRSKAELEIGFDKRPFFLLVGVDAPVTARWKREVRRRASRERSISLEDFVIADDDQLYGLPTKRRQQPASHDLPLTPSSTHSTSLHNGLDSSTDLAAVSHQVVLPSGIIASQTPSQSLRSLMESTTLTIQNPYLTLSSLHTHLSSLSLSSTHRLRPSWDTYFLSLCTLASLRSNCMKRRVGAVLIRNNRVLSTGYNGTPRGLTNCAEGGCSRCNGGAAGGTALDECLCLHAEENALLECGRESGGAEGTVLYCNTCPCLRCAVKIVQTGVREVVYQLTYSMDDRSRTIFQEAGVKIRQTQPM
ncbi:hypothetical protein CBS101457_001634 [Exobasidium rhododendri]|nr:hypothetical protein CBS101457_001634 [Exobasidium rhododendri]